MKAGCKHSVMTSISAMQTLFVTATEAPDKGIAQPLGGSSRLLHIEVGGQSQRVPLAMSGTFLSQPISSFTAELIALDEAILYMYQLVLKCTGFPRKRAQTRAEPSA